MSINTNELMLRGGAWVLVPRNLIKCQSMEHKYSQC